jgi:hypothetical protein
LVVKIRVEELNVEADVSFLNGTLVNVDTGHNKEDAYKRGGKIVEGNPVGLQSDWILARATSTVACIFMKKLLKDCQRRPYFYHFHDN